MHFSPCSSILNPPFTPFYPLSVLSPKSNGEEWWENWGASAIPLSWPSALHRTHLMTQRK